MSLGVGLLSVWSRVKLMGAIKKTDLNILQFDKHKWQFLMSLILLTIHMAYTFIVITTNSLLLRHVCYILKQFVNMCYQYWQFANVIYYQYYCEMYMYAIILTVTVGCMLSH